LDIRNLKNIEEVDLSLPQPFNQMELFGNLDQHMKIVREHFNVEIIQRDNQLLLKGSDSLKAKKVLEELVEIIQSGEKLDAQKVYYVIGLQAEGISYSQENVNNEILCFTHMGKPIKPKTLGQKAYTKAIRESDVIFAIGPAGTGKTYLAVAMAINAYKNKEIQKIILARPAVEAGERLGFLPGDLQEKVDPYLRPLYDALYEILGRESALKLKEKETIEVVPLAYMRGRTLDNSFIILDEAQNSTKEQMKMFLTRMGFGSKVVITGDITQIDLPKGKRSGLVEAAKILKPVKDIRFCYLKDVDVVRHELVKKIINAYEKYYKEHPKELEEE
jgi:phosphate starvation-inducible PhoH-like protein